MNGISYYVRDHSMQITSDGSTRACSYCNSRAGIGFYFFMRCELRFNESGFRKYLNFRNLSETKEGKYVQRYSTIEYTKEEIMDGFKNSCDQELTEKIINMPEYFDENRT